MFTVYEYTVKYYIAFLYMYPQVFMEIRIVFYCLDFYKWGYTVFIVTANILGVFVRHWCCYWYYKHYLYPHDTDRRLRNPAVKWLVQGHVARKWQTQGLNPGFLIAELLLITKSDHLSPWFCNSHFYFF